MIASFVLKDLTLKEVIALRRDAFIRYWKYRDTKLAHSALNELLVLDGRYHELQYFRIDKEKNNETQSTQVRELRSREFSYREGV